MSDGARLSLDWPEVLAGLEGEDLRVALLALADELSERAGTWLRRAARRRYGLDVATGWPAGAWWVSSAWGWHSPLKRKRAGHPEHHPELCSVVPRALAGRMVAAGASGGASYRCTYRSRVQAWRGLLGALREEWP